MNKKAFVLPLISLAMFLGLASCSPSSGNNPGGDTPGGDTPGGGEVTPEKFVFTNVSAVFNAEEENVKISYTLQSDDAFVDLRIQGKELGGYFHIEDYKSGKAISTQQSGFADDEYYVTLNAMPKDGSKYLPSDEYKGPSFTVKHIPITTPTSLDYCRATKFAYGKCVGKVYAEPGDENYNSKELEDATPGWFVVFDYHFSNAYLQPRLYMFNENNECISGSEVQSGEGWVLPYNLEVGKYHFTIQGRGWYHQANEYTCYDILNTDVYPVEGVYTVKTPIVIRDLKYGYDDIISWEVVDKELVKNYSISIYLDNEDQELVYTATETTPFHKLNVSELTANTKYIAKVKAIGDEEKYGYDSIIESIKFTNQHGDYDYIGSNTCDINISVTEDWQVRVKYTMEHDSYISISVIDLSTNKMILRKINEHAYSGYSEYFELRELRGKNLRFNFFAYDTDHQYRDGVATKDFEIPAYSQIPYIESVEAERVDNKFFIDVKTTAEPTKLFVQMRRQLPEGGETIEEITTKEGERYVYDLSDYPYKYFYSTINVYTYLDNEDNIIDHFILCYSDPDKIEIFDLDCDISEKIDGNNRVFTVKINDESTLVYPFYSYSIADGTQPITDGSIGSPNFNEETGKYNDTFSFIVRKSDLKSGQTYTLTFSCWYQIDEPEGEIGQIGERKCEKVIQFTAL